CSRSCESSASCASAAHRAAVSHAVWLLDRISFAPDVRNNLGSCELPWSGRPLLSRRRALGPAEPGGAFSLASNVHDRGVAFMRPRIVFGTILSLPPAWPLLCPAPPLPSFVRALLFGLLATELVY